MRCVATLRPCSAWQGEDRKDSRHGHWPGGACLPERAQHGRRLLLVSEQDDLHSRPGRMQRVARVLLHSSMAWHRAAVALHTWAGHGNRPSLVEQGPSGMPAALPSCLALTRCGSEDAHWRCVSDVSGLMPAAGNSSRAACRQRPRLRHDSVHPNSCSARCCQRKGRALKGQAQLASQPPARALRLI